MLSFKEFQGYVMDHIREYLPEEYANAEVSVRTVQKLNGVTLQGLEIWTPEMKQGTGVTPTIYLNGIYENYENGVDLEVIMEHIGNLERQSMDLPEDVAEIKEMYKDVNYVKDRLIVSLISAERNVDFLKEIVRRIYAAMVRTEYLVYEMFPEIRPTLPQQIHFIHSEDLLQKYPTFTPKW